MVKRVVENSMVAHLWAAQSQPSARSPNGNFSFDGPILYSYAEPIARFVLDAEGRTVVLHRGLKFSVTTSRHQSTARGAARHVTSYTVNRIGRYPTDEIDHVRNVADMVAEYREILGRMKRSHSEWENAERIREGAEQIRAYVAAFKIDAPVPDAGTDIADVAAFRAAREARSNDPKNVRARERKAERQREKLRADFVAGATYGYREERRMFALFATDTEAVAARDATLAHRYRSQIAAWRTDPDAHIGYEAMNLATDEDRAAHASAVALTNAEKIDRWRRGEGSPYSYPRGAPIAMRIEGEEIVTSQGARFPVSHGKRAFAFIAAQRAKGEAWTTNGHTIHLGSFHIDRIAANGDVHAGCHFVTWDEIALTARTLGLEV